MFKLVKVICKEGYDPDVIKEPLLVLKPGKSCYEPLDREFFERIRAGTAGY